MNKILHDFGNFSRQEINTTDDDKRKLASKRTCYLCSEKFI